MHLPLGKSVLKSLTFDLRRLRGPRLRLGLVVLVMLPFIVSRVHFVPLKRLSRVELERIPELNEDYDPATALNIDSYASDLQSAIRKVDVAKTAPPKSFLSEYQALPRQCSLQPHRHHLRQALDKMRSTNRHSLPASLSDSDTIHIQVVCTAFRPGKNTSFEETFLEEATTLSGRFAHVTLFPIRAAGVPEYDCHKDVRALARHLQRASPTHKRPSVVFSQSADHHLLLSASAAHLMLHRGPHSALSGLLSQNQVYSGKSMEKFTDRDAYQWLLTHHTRLPIRPRTEQSALLDAMGPVVPSCCELRAFGKGDNEKVVCTNAASFPPPADTGGGRCWMLSVGCTDQLDFEVALLAHTHCVVNSFDCMRDFKKGDFIVVHDHVTVYKRSVMLGREKQLKSFRNWNMMLDFISLFRPGLPRMPPLLKIDVQGWEMSLLDRLITEGSTLPEQIVMEIHSGDSTKYGTSFADKEATRAWFAKMEEAGYRLVHRADSPSCANCSDVTFVQAKALPVH